MFTAPFHQHTDGEGLQLPVLYKFPLQVLHWAMCGNCLCSFYIPYSQTDAVGLLLLIGFTSPFWVPHHPAGAGMFSLDRFLCRIPLH